MQLVALVACTSVSYTKCYAEIYLTDVALLLIGSSAFLGLIFWPFVCLVVKNINLIDFSDLSCKNVSKTIVSYSSSAAFFK